MLRFGDTIPTRDLLEELGARFDNDPNAEFQIETWVRRQGFGARQPNSDFRRRAIPAFILFVFCILFGGGAGLFWLFAAPWSLFVCLSGLFVVTMLSSMIYHPE